MFGSYAYSRLVCIFRPKALPLVAGIMFRAAVVVGTVFEDLARPTEAGPVAVIEAKMLA